MIADTAIVQKKEEGNTIHPNNIKTVSANGTRLLLMLSNIFHLDKADNGFLFHFFPGKGANGKNQENICQSPRIQRENLFISEG